MKPDANTDLDYVCLHHFISVAAFPLMCCQTQSEAATHCRWLQTVRTEPGPTRSLQKNVMTCAPSGIFSSPVGKKKKGGA